MVCPTILAPAVLVSTLLLSCYGARHDGEAVLLEDVKVLTLRHGEMTNGRRSSPVPQLKCIGGTAGCEAFRPQVVQCYNRGSDGYDIQWECKTDMDNAYRFGKVQVSCEGYTYPDDPYILKGSCGLEYSLDLTAEGHQQRQHQGDHQYYAKPHHHEYHDRSQHSTGYGKKATSILGDLMYLAIVAAFIYFIYKKCIAQPLLSDDPPPYDEARRDAPHGTQPPPYGFRQDYMPNTGGGSCSGGTGTSQSTHTNTAPSTGGGFWSGAMTGGLLGYLFGNRNNYSNYGYTHQHRRPGWGWGTGGGWGTGTGWGTGWGSGWGSNSSTRTTYSSSTPSAPRSSGTRTASGFGGTSRR